MVHDGEDGTTGACFGVGCGVDETRDACVEYGSGAHGAGFECGVEGAVFQAIVAQMEGGLTEGDDLGVGGGVGVAEDAGLAAADDLILVDDDGADGDFAADFGGLGFGDGGSEVKFVGFGLRVEGIGGHRLSFYPLCGEVKLCDE